MASRRVRVVTADLNRFAERLIKRLVINLVRGLKETTPKDTTWASVNWIPQIGSARVAPSGTREAARAGLVSDAEQTAGVSRVGATYKLRMGAVHITNLVPYIVELNEGSSAKAPAAFVQATIFRSIVLTISGG